MPPLLVAVVVLGAVGCKKVDPAPEDLDGLYHWFWENYELGDDAAVADAVDKLHGVLEGDDFDALQDGSITDLVADQIRDLPIEGSPDPEATRGMYIVKVFECDLDQLEQILYHQDQGNLYGDAYDTYSRDYLSDIDAYVARQAPSVEWSVTLTAEMIGATFTEWLNGGLRYVSDPESVLGPALVARTYMTKPAVFEGSNSKSFDQDYQIEVFYERAPGEILHAYGIWRALDLGGGLSMEDDAVVRVILNNLADWDDHTEDLCAEGRP